MGRIKSPTSLAQYRLHYICLIIKYIFKSTHFAYVVLYLHDRSVERRDSQGRNLLERAKPRCSVVVLSIRALPIDQKRRHSCSHTIPTLPFQPTNHPPSEVRPLPIETFNQLRPSKVTMLDKLTKVPEKGELSTEGESRWFSGRPRSGGQIQVRRHNTTLETLRPARVSALGMRQGHFHKSD